MEGSLYTPKPPGKLCESLCRHILYPPALWVRPTLCCSHFTSAIEVLGLFLLHSLKYVKGVEHRNDVSAWPGWAVCDPNDIL